MRVKRSIAVGLVLSGLSFVNVVLARPAFAGVMSPGYPVYSAVERITPGDAGIRGYIKTPTSASNTSSTNYVAGYVRVANTPTSSTNWFEVGWIWGACGSGCTSTEPVVFTAYRDGTSSTVWNTYSSSFPLTKGSAYDFLIGNVGGNSWRADIYYGGAWHILKTVTMNWGVSQNYPLQTVEYYAPSGQWVPLPGSDVEFTSQQVLQSGSWNAWDDSQPTTAAEDSSLPGTRWMAFDNYYDDWRVSATAPTFTEVANPTSLTVLPGTSRSSTITVTTNKTYDSEANFEGPITLDVQNIPTGVLAQLDAQAITPTANDAWPTLLTVTVLVPQVNPFTLDVEACGNGGAICKHAYVTVTDV